MSGDEMEDEKYSSSNAEDEFYPDNNEDFLSLRPQVLKQILFILISKYNLFLRIPLFF